MLAATEDVLKFGRAARHGLCRPAGPSPLEAAKRFLRHSDSEPEAAPPNCAALAAGELAGKRCTIAAGPRRRTCARKLRQLGSWLERGRACRGYSLGRPNSIASEALGIAILVGNVGRNFLYPGQFLQVLADPMTATPGSLSPAHLFDEIRIKKKLDVSSLNNSSGGE